jgi:thiamine biosynthesis lipoprotein
MRVRAPFRFRFRAMAAEHELQLYADTRTDAEQAANAAIADVARIEAKYSRYRDDSVTTRINRAAGAGVRRDRCRDRRASAVCGSLFPIE